MNFKKDKNALSIPWVESPFFNELVKNNPHPLNNMATEFHNNGYVKITPSITDREVDIIIKDVAMGIEGEKAILQDDIYKYNEAPRVFEGWRDIESVKQLTLQPEILDALEFLYNKTAYPFSTINFTKGSNQPLHSDAIHFHTIPQLWMCGVWIALEDVSEQNGALTVVPGSHKLPVFEYPDMNLPHPDDVENGKEENYRVYEEFVKDLVDASPLEKTTVPMKKGEVLIWAANLLHGGSEILDPNSTRHSQAIHYFFEGCDEYYHPMFSNRNKGQYASKWCDENNNIRINSKK